MDTQKVNCVPLRQIVAQFLPRGQIVDFLSIDVEGMDLEVLQSNDWEACRPNIILCEYSCAPSLESLPELEIKKYLERFGYTPIARTAMTFFFARRDRIQKALIGYKVG